MELLGIFNCFSTCSPSSETKLIQARQVSSLSSSSADLHLQEKGNALAENTSALQTPPATSVASQKQLQSPTQKSEQDDLYHDALMVTSTGRYEVLKVASQQSLGEMDVMISTRAVGLNPIDWKSVDYNFCLPEFPWIAGREMSGVVERVGSGVCNVRPGQRVWTSTYYKKREAGCFQRRVVAPCHTVLPIPNNLDFEAAACLGVPGITAAMTLWHWLEEPLPSKRSALQASSPRWMLIWGGSTITGQFLIQLATLSGLQVVTVTSSKTASVVRKYGAASVVERDGKTNEAIVEEIRGIVNGQLQFAIDIVGPSTAVHAINCLSQGQPAIIAPLSFLPKGYEAPSNVEVADIQMKTFILQEGSRVYAEELDRLIAAGLVRMPEFECQDGGLGGIPEGLRISKCGDRAGEKLVVSI